ncbi:hypothetical protein HDU67_005461 [Dinochytrium kinnereticum]|nr:hypothetical protein HDU67_005461 [Dinochytrium kinnereticum]
MPRTPKIHPQPLKVDGDVGKSMATLESAAALDMEVTPARRTRPNTASSRRNDPYAIVGGDSVDATKRHWLWLCFGDVGVEREFVKFAYVRERTSMMTFFVFILTVLLLEKVANAILILIASTMIILTIRLSNGMPTLNTFTTWIIPQILLLIIHITSLVASSLRRIKTCQIASIIFLIHAIAFQPVWSFAWNRKAVGPSVQLVVLQSVALMIFPTPVKHSFVTVVGSLVVLVCGFAVLHGVTMPGVEEDENRRRDAIRTALDSLGIDYDIDNWLTPIPMNKPDVEHALMRAEVAKEKERRNPSSRPGTAVGTRPGTAGARPGSAAARSVKSRPQTAKSKAQSVDEDDQKEGRPSRPATAAGRALSAIGNAYGDAKEKAKAANSYPLNRKALMPDKPDEHLNLVFAIFLGQEPWPPSGERKYLRCQAQLHSDHAVFLILRLGIANLIISILDHFDRIRRDGSKISFDVVMHRFLIQIIPSISIPAVSIIVFVVLRRMRLLLWIQPLILITFSGLAASYLLGPMELLSSVSPDMFLQSKESAYLALTVILCAQCCLMVARSFAAWCFAVLFLTLAHIPLVLSWGGLEHSMPYYMAVQILFLITAMAAQVRAFEALSREGYETMHAVRLGNKALSFGGGKMRRILASRRRGDPNADAFDDDDFGGTWENSYGDSEKGEERGEDSGQRSRSLGNQRGKKVIDSQHAVIEVEPFDGRREIEEDDTSYDSDDDSTSDDDHQSNYNASIYDLYDIPHSEDPDDVEEIMVESNPPGSKMTMAMQQSFAALELLVAQIGLTTTASKLERNISTPIPQRFEVGTGNGKRPSNIEKLTAFLADESWKSEWVDTNDQAAKKITAGDEAEYVSGGLKASRTSSLRDIVQIDRVGDSVITASLHSLNSHQPFISKDEPVRAIGSTLERLDAQERKQSISSPPFDSERAAGEHEARRMPELEQTNFEAIERTIAEPVVNASTDYERIDPLENLTRITPPEDQKDENEEKRSRNSSVDGSLLQKGILSKHGKLAASVSLQHFFTEIPNEPIVDSTVDTEQHRSDAMPSEEARMSQVPIDTIIPQENISSDIHLASESTQGVPISTEGKERSSSRPQLEAKQSNTTLGHGRVSVRTADIKDSNHDISFNSGSDHLPQPIRSSVPLAPAHVPFNSTKPSPLSSDDIAKDSPALARGSEEAGSHKPIKPHLPKQHKRESTPMDIDDEGSYKPLSPALAPLETQISNKVTEKALTAASDSQGSKGSLADAKSPKKMPGSEGRIGGGPSSDVLSGSSSGIFHAVGRGTRLPLVGDEKDLFEEPGEISSSGTLKGSRSVTGSTYGVHRRRASEISTGDIAHPMKTSSKENGLDEVKGRKMSEPHTSVGLSPSVFSSTASIHPWMGGGANPEDPGKNTLPANTLSPTALGQLAAVGATGRRLQPLGSIRGIAGAKLANGSLSSVARHEGMNTVPEDFKADLEEKVAEEEGGK